MRTTSLLSVFCVLLSPLFASARPGADDTGSVPTFVAGEGDRVFDSASARGSLLAVHYLSGAMSEADAAALSEFGAKSATLAGVRHVFVRASSAEEFGAFLAGAPASVAALLFRDADAKLAQSLRVPTGCAASGRPAPCPAVIVFDEQGTEIFRWVGANGADRLGFDALAAKVGEVTRDAEARESNLAGGVALQGFDPVAYLDEGKAVAGNRSIESSFRGVRYRFATAGSRGAFNADPVKYMPAYGGWCATAMAKGEKVEVDPKNFKVTSGRVFLFYKGFFGNALNDWNKDEPTLTARADSGWRAIVSK